jgi:uncharacterized delta-60 repeat protein
VVVTSTCAIAVLWGAVGTAQADYPMALDPTFGSGGTLLTPIGTALGANDARANALTLQPDGKLVAAGYARESRNDIFALARYSPDGSLDTNFGTGGIVETRASPPASDGGDDQAESVVVQGDGKLVAAGYAASGGTGDYFVLARYNADGSLDATFNPSAPATCPGTFNVVGCQGLVEVQASGNTSRARSVVVQADGKYVVGGFALDSVGGTKFALVRYNVNGTLDTSFGSSGKVLTAVGNGGVSGIFSLALQADGKIVAAGTASDGGRDKFALVRYNANGTVDTTFGSGGMTLTPVGSGDANLNSLAVDDSGNLVVAGSALTGTDHVFALARYGSDGALDTSFGYGGTTLTSIGSDGGAVARSVATQGQQLLVGGVASDAGVAQFAFARYDATGALDTTFSSTGAVLVPVGNGEFASAASVVSDDSGRPVAAGYASNDGANVFGLARLVPTPPAPSPGPPGPTPGSSCFKRFTAVICPGAPTTSSAGRCSVQTSSAKMSRSGRVSLRLNCTGVASGTLTLKTKKTTVGRASFSVKRATSMTLKVKLSKKARLRIRKAKRLRVQATVSHDGASASKTSKNLTIKAPAKKKKKKR